MTTSVLKMQRELVAVTEERDRLAAELQKLREQEPFCFATPVETMGHDWTRAVFFSERNEVWKATVPLYAAPVAAPAVPAPSVSDEWREALADMLSIIESAGIMNLANGVQLGQVSWSVKMTDACNYARALLQSTGGAK